MAFVETYEHLVLNEETEQRLVNLLTYELDTAEMDRKDVIGRLVEEAEAFRATEGPAKMTPWPGASHIVVPVIASSAYSVFPRLHSTVFGAQNVVTVEEWPGDLAEHAKAWEDMLQWVFDHELKLERVAKSWFLESVVHGTSVVKVGWERLERETVRYNDAGKLLSRESEIIRNQPVLTHIPLEDFYIRINATSISEAPWCAHRIHTLWDDIKLREANGLYKDVDRIKNQVDVDAPEYRSAIEDLEGTSPNITVDEYELFEVWLDFDLFGDGVVTPIVVTFHLPTRTILRAQSHPYKHRRKPFREVVYEPYPGRFYGIGLATSLKALQDEISTIHNQRIDSGTIANSRMYKVMAGSRADQSFQYASPNLKVLVDAMDEFEPVEMGGALGESISNEQISLQYVMQRAGQSELAAGVDFGRTGGRQTATQTVAQMQEQRTRFNWTLDEFRSAIGDISSMVTDMYEQFAGDQEIQQKFTSVLGEEKGQLLVEMFVDRARENPLSMELSLMVTASSSSTNKAIEGQNLMGLMQLLQQYTTGFEMPLVQMIVNPQTPTSVKEFALERLEGSRLLFRRLLEISDARNSTQILGTAESLRSAATETPQPTPGDLGLVAGGAGVGGGSSPEPQGVEGSGVPIQ